MATLIQEVSTSGTVYVVNAAVVGVLIAALIRPVWTSAVHSRLDMAVAVAGLVLLVRYKVPAWLLVLSVTLFSALISFR